MELSGVKLGRRQRFWRNRPWHRRPPGVRLSDSTALKQIPDKSEAAIGAYVLDPRPHSEASTDSLDIEGLSQVTPQAAKFKLSHKT